MGCSVVYIGRLGIANMGGGALSDVVYGFSGHVDFNRGWLAGLYRDNSFSAVGRRECDVKGVS